MACCPLLTIIGWNCTSYPIECKSPRELTLNGLSLHALCCVVSHTAPQNSSHGECSCALRANFTASAPLSKHFVKPSLVPNSTIISWKFLPTFRGLIKRLLLRKRQQQLSKEKVTKSIESLKAWEPADQGGNTSKGRKKATKTETFSFNRNFCYQNNLLQRPMIYVTKWKLAGLPKLLLFVCITTNRY